MDGYVCDFESCGLVDGPGIRTVVFLGGCKLRCKYCHNPEMWVLGEKNMSSSLLLKKILRYKPYFGESGGVTFSGGEPLMQREFLLDMCHKLKRENIHIALDTAGVCDYDASEILGLVDLIIFDIKFTEPLGYKNLTGQSIDFSERFISVMNKSNKPVWIRQVIIPGFTDSYDYIYKLASYLKKIKNVEKVEFLPFHHLGFSKYEKLGYVNAFAKVPSMDASLCDDLYKEFMKVYKA